MIKLVALYGTGDCYLLSALFRSFLDHHESRVGAAALICKPEHEAIPLMFGIEPTLDADLVRQGESNLTLQANHDNHIGQNNVVFVHPSFVRSGVRIDHLTAHSFVSQADLYRGLLHLPMNTPLAKPDISSHIDPDFGQDRVLLIPEARSWPNSQPGFWTLLAAMLKGAGHEVEINQPDWSLTRLLNEIGVSSWVIGPQCGVMSILCEAQFPCRKTFCTPSVPKPRPLGFLVDQTFPYGYVTKFAGHDWAVDEYEIGDKNHELIISHILASADVWPHPKPVTSFSMPLTPGDFLDRLAVLMVKGANFKDARRVAVRRELERYVEVYTSQPKAFVRVGREFEELIAVNQNIFTHSATLVPEAIDGNISNLQAHARIIQLNKRRVELKQQIDQAMDAAYSEVKDYYR